jgi:hypothetical protein
MKSLWFKQVYVADILSGQKCDTIRKMSAFNKFNPDEPVQLQVGPRKPFAIAFITQVAKLERKYIQKERLTTLDNIYGCTDFFTIIRFKIIQKL